MIGRRIESRGALPWGSWLLLVLGLCMLIGGLVNGERSLALASVMPVSIGLCVLFLGREPRLVAEFTEGSIEVEDPMTSIPYASLIGVRAGGIAPPPGDFRKSRMLIEVEHEGGVLVIPSRLDVPSHEVYRFLASRVPPSGNRAVDETLTEYLERQEKDFGPEQVWTYKAVARKARSRSLRGFRSFCLGMILTGLIWAGVGATGVVDKDWMGSGVVAFTSGILFWLVTVARSDLARQSIKGWKRASLVIGPQGMAMIQGEVQGEVRWPELLDVKYKPKHSTFRLHYSQGLSGILLKVKGATIRIADIYDRPLYVIHERIMAASGRTIVEEIDL